MSETESRRRRVRRNPWLSFEEFQALVEHALDQVPEPFVRALDEVAVTIEDEPTPAQRRELGLRPGQDLYGLFEGVPRTEWAADWAMVPSRITLFRLALQEDFPDPASGGTSSGAAPASNSPRRPGSTLPPLNTTQTRSPSRIGTRPNSTAARAAAPAGSTSCFIRSRAKRTPARIVASSIRTMPSR
jgi:predicted Zn-dependent protease with MMP-like domain